ncbi:BTAD domain-containing putative transcriptional regulator [Pseudonocardia hispaniensis]|uniref:BTAD domain-containing putative transcriptional regulator n=1 Tax=Pseudonocardia hispaniensis TaxID=904933 RepID=A0ABW1J2W1_9PSEU
MGGVILVGVQAMLRVLGTVEVVGPGGGAVQPAGPKERCLLAVLSMHVGEVVAEDRLVDALWGQSPPRTAAKTLQNYVLRLRRRLEGCGDAAIVTRPPGYALEGVTTDVAMARTLVVEGRRAAERGEHAAAIGRFDEALALWRGPAFAEFADRAFARPEVAGLEQLRASIVEERMASVLAAGGHRDAVAECEKLVAEEPLRERRWMQLMLALYRDGRQGEALEAFRRLRAVLADELGVAPTPEARQLEAAILAQDPALQLRISSRGPARVRQAESCFGRERELATLLSHLADASAGRGRVTFVSGEPGIGKSRLLAELGAQAATRGARVLAGRSLDGSGALPFHPFVEAIEAFLDGRPAPSALGQLLQDGRTPADPALQPDERRMHLLDGMARFLVGCAVEAPVVLIVDDLHWADDGTVAMLRHVARSTLGHRLLVVGAYRASEVTDEHPLADALGALRSEAECSELRLAGLDRGAVEQLMRAIADAPVAADLVEAVWAETHGNPFFAREIVQHLREEGELHAGPDGALRTRMPLAIVPEGVRQVIARRRRRLTDVTNRLLDVAATVEGPFLFEPIRSAAGLSDADGLAALDEALRAALVVPDPVPDRYDFTHALIRHTVRRELNPSRRLRLHRDVAAALAAARANGARISAAEVAIQYHHAASLRGEPGSGVDPALEAADRAGAAGAHDEQATFLQIACDLLPANDDRRADLLGRRAAALAWALRFDDAVDTARAAAAAGAGPAVIAQVATVLATAGSTTHAWQLAATAVRSATGPDGDDPQSWAVLTLLDLDRREAADPTHPGMQLDLPGRRGALRILHESGQLVRRGDLARYAVAAVYGRRSRIPAAAAADPTVAAFLLGDYAAAVPLFAQEADDAEAHGRLAWAVYCRAGQARCQVALGDLAEAVTTLEHTRQLVARLSGIPLGWQLLHHQGAEDALATALDEGWPERMDRFAPWMAPGPDRHWGSAGIAGVGARAQARMGRADAALALLARPVRALSLAPAWAPNYTRTACEVAETLWLLDRRDHLAVVERALRDKALPADFRFPMTDARLALARLCALDGRAAEAHTWFDAARAVLDAQGALPLRAVVDHDEARMHLRAGDAAAAASYLTAAGTAFDRLGMTGWSRRLTFTTTVH